MQKNLLDKYPEVDIKVYTVWLPMISGDARDKVQTSLISDTRVTHFWDGNRIAGKWYATQGGHPEQIAWDIYFLYGPDAKWDPTLKFVVSWGNPVARVKEKLEKDFLDLVNKG